VSIKGGLPPSHNSLALHLLSTSALDQVYHTTLIPNTLTPCPNSPSITHFETHMMVLQFRPYVPPQRMPQKLKRQQHAVSLPQNHIQTSNGAEDFDDIRPSQCTGETVKEITGMRNRVSIEASHMLTEVKSDETPGSPDELPSVEELWKAKWPNGNTSARPSVPSTFTSLDNMTSSTSHVQTGSDTESSGKTQGMY
jgi:hypothetical protein